MIDVLRELAIGVLVVTAITSTSYLVARAVSVAYFRSKLNFVREVGGLVKEGVERHGKAG